VPTAVSTPTSYASAADLVAAHDWRKLADWASDTGVALAGSAAVQTDAVVAAALLRASGIVEMHCYRGGKYTPTMLSALTGASAAALKGLVCDLACYLLARRRVPNAESVPGYKEAVETLKLLSDGELVFGLQEAADAGVMGKVDISTDEDGILNRPTEVFKRFFGSRASQSTSNPVTGSS
jgi:phage gp36-like protein